jgi:thiamine transporter
MNLNQVILAEGNKQLDTTNQVRHKNQSGFRNPRILAEVAIFIALSLVLSIPPIFKMPQGGSVTLASMVPLLLLGLRRGPKVGIFAGVVYGFVDMAISHQVYYPTQVLLDYPLAFGCMGLIGFFKNNPIAGVKNRINKSENKSLVGFFKNNPIIEAIIVVIGVTVAFTGRFIMHLISGAIFFAEFAPVGMNPWVYSLVYNSGYILVELIISCIILIVLNVSQVSKVYMQ